MNKIYHIVWNQSSNQWVVAAETARSHGSGTLKATVAAVLLAFAASAQAACPADTGGLFTVSTAETCTAAQSAYTGPRSAGGTVQATAAGSVINITGADVTITNTSIANAAYGLLARTGATINATGNVNAVTNGFAGRAVIGAAGSSIHIGGNLTATNQTSSQGSGIDMAAGSVLTVGGTTTIATAAADGMRLNGTASFAGDVVINANNYTHGIYNTGTANFDGNLTVNTKNIYYAGIRMVGGVLNVAKNLSVIHNDTPSKGGILMEGGKLTVQGDTNVSTNILGVGSIGISATGAGAIFEGLGTNNTISTEAANTHGLFASGAGAVVAVGTAAVTSTGPSVLLGAGNVTTKGDNAEGIYALSGASDVTVVATQSGGSINTAGVDADGIVAYANGATATGVTANATQSGGTITTTGGATTISGIPSNGSAGMIAQVAGTGLAQTTQSAGSINTSGMLGFGMVALNSGTGDATTTQAGAVTTTGELAQGVYASANAGNATVNSSGTVSTAGKSAAGILAVASDDITINQTGSITTTGVGQSVYLPIILAAAGVSSPDAGNADGILAFSSEGNVTINSANINAAGDGIDGNTGEANMTITTTGTLTAGEEGIDAEIDDAKGAVLTINNNAILTAAGTGILASSDGGTSIINNTNSITSNGSDGINVANVSDGSTITNSGDITATTPDKFVIAGGDAVETVTTTAGKLTGNTDLGAGNDSFTASGGALIGNTLMGDGDDVTTLTGTVDVTAAPQFDGGVGTDVLNVDGLALRGFTAASNDGTGNLTETNNSNLTGWETINVKNAGTLKLSNNLFTAANTGTLNVDATSTLDLKGNFPGIFTIFGDVNNSGMMTMADGAADDLTTITGNYTGVAGSQFAIDTVLGDDSSLTDKLVVNGNTSGTTALAVTNAGGAGAQTVEGIQVVQVDGTSDGTFSLAAPVQAGSYEYTLQKNGVSTPTDGDWYLRSTFVATCANTPSLCPVDPIDPVDPPKPPVYIYRPGVALYVTAQSANADAGFLQMSTLHQRMGEQRDLPTDKPQTWGRLIGAGVSNAGGNRFEYDQFTTGFQFGHDLLHKTSSTGTQQRAGVTVQYAHSSMDAKDRVRPLVGLGEDTGSMNSNSVGLGGYYTRMNQAGAYLDVVSQVNHLTNKFSDSYGGNSKQKGWQFGLSAEVGKPVADLGGWKFEPQAQLSYLHTRYDDFTDRYSNIDGLNASQLRGRLGLRVYKDFKVDNKAAQYYGIVNVHHDFLKAKSITLNDRVGNGSASVRESYDRTFGEVGLGIQGHIRNNTYVYADARYQRSFKGNKEGAQFNVGIKASF